MPDNLTLDSVTATPGTKAHGHLKVAEHLDGSPERIPFILANGVKPGPTLWITACEHGDETLATATVIEFMSRLDPTELSGKVVALPVLDSTGFNVKMRFSPIDHMDFSRAYPGMANGWLAQQVTYRIMELMIPSANFAINVHDGIPGRLDVSPYCVATYNDLSQWNDGLKDFTESFLYPKLIHWIGTSTERGERTTTMMSTLMAEGILNFVPEVGPDTRSDTRGGLTTGIEGFENSLRYLKMLPGEARKLEEYQSFPDVIHMFPTRGGVFQPLVKLDETVKKGQKLSQTRSFTGEITEELVSPADGVIVTLWTNPVIGSGDFCAFEIATFDEFNEDWPAER